jgi:2-oxoisovalerate dehydrogenase E2 component (dihydrolipoyl transacylase)
MNTKSFSSYSNNNDNDPTMEDNDGGSNNTITTTIPFVLADIGEGIAEVELLQWFVSPGDKINQFDRVCEVQSDKASVEITSRYDGVVSLLCGNVGDVMRVGQPLLYITLPTTGTTNADSNNIVSSSSSFNSSDDTALPVMQQSSTSTLPLNNVDDVQDRLSIPLVGAKYSIGSDDGYDTTVSTTTMTNSNPSSKVLTSPSVRKLGKENNINLSNVIGTGPDGRILKSDLLRIIDPASTTPALPIIPSLYPTTTSPTFPSSSPKSTGAATSATSAATSSERKEEFDDDDDKVIPIRGYHRLMVKSMTLSLQVPHMIYADEININSLITARNTLRQSMLRLEGGVVKVSYMPFFIKATSLALYKYPILNSTINVDQMTVTHHTSHNIGIAVDTSKGLVVPVITNCQRKSIIDITMELHHILALANEGNLTEKEITNATFTISNIGSIGGTYMSPIIVPPQVAIGALGKISRVPRFINDTSDVVESVHVMPISWGGDHRVVDGATMARFSNVFKLYIENPVSMMFDMR